MKKRYVFKSSSRPGVKYTTIRHDDGRITCDCPGWIYHAARRCKHVLKVEIRNLDLAVKIA